MQSIPRTLRVLFAAALMPAAAPAAPTAVNDTFTTPEDVPAGTSAVNLISATFNPASSFSLPAGWDYLDAMKATTAGGTGQYPVDAASNNWKSLVFDKATSTIGPWKSASMPIQGGGIDGLPGAENLLTGITGNQQTNTVHAYLFRNKFTMTADQVNSAPLWSISVLADDGCIIYVNGNPMGRINYPESVAVTPDAVVGGQGGSETAYFTLVVPSSTFTAGENIIAVELHQNSVNSSDAGIDLRLSPYALDGFTAAVDTFFDTERPDFSTSTYSATQGFGNTGALALQMGNVFDFGGGGGSTAVSGAWRKAFTLTSPATVTVSFRHRMVSGRSYDNNEYQEVICDVDGTQHGTVTAPSTHKAVSFQIGDGNNGDAMDTGWKQNTFEIPLTAGNHTLSLGGYGNAGTAGFQGNTSEAFTVYLDDVSVTVPGSVSLLANDTGGTPPVTAAKASDPAHGTVTVNADGSFNYVPAANYFGTDTFTYRAVDGTGQSNPATVTINVTSVNDLPQGVPDTYTTTQGTAFTINPPQGLLANDTDADHPASALRVLPGTNPAGGQLTLRENGSFDYLPNGPFSGADTFTYRVTDGTDVSPPITVTVNVTDIPDSPVSAADTYTAIKNVPLNVSATTSGTVVDEVLPYESEEWHYLDSLVRANRNPGTAWRTDAFVETADWKTGQAELGYGDDDENTAIADNPDPAFDSAAGDKFLSYYFRRTVEITDTFNITEVSVQMLYDDGGVFYINGTEAGRTDNMQDAPEEVPFDYVVQGNSDDNSTQNWTLPPAALLPGTNLFAVQVHQNAATSSDLSFDLRIRLTRQVAGGVLVNDTDPDPGQKETLVAEAVTQPAHGTLTLNPNGTFLYTPANGYTGPDSFTYRAKDTTGRTSAVATAAINVITGPNVPPVASPDTYAATEDTLLNVNAATGVLANDTDAESDPFTATLVTGAAHGTVTLNSNGSFTYQPNAHYNGPDSFTYRAEDARRSPPATVTINVASVNDVPVAANDSYAGDPGKPLAVSALEGVLANDTDADTGTALTAELVTPPATGTLTLNADGSFSFTAAAGGTYSFTYRAKDAASQSPPATVTLSLNAVPVTAADTYTVTEDTALSRTAAQGVLANDSDPESQPLTVEVATNAAHGTLVLNGNGSFTYTPAADYFGSDTFTYRVSDGVRTSAPVTVTLNVTAVNDPPVAVADIYGVRIDTPFSVPAASGVLRNDTDVDNTTLTVTLVTPPQDGIFTLNPDGSFSYTPVTGFSGARSFTYRTSDGTAQSSTVTVTLNVSADLNTVVVSEIMFNPPGINGAAEEFIEFYNYGDSAVDLTGWRITKGVNYDFPAGSLISAKGYLVVPASKAAFTTRYPAASNVTATAWEAGSSLSNSGENIRLLNSEGEIVNEMEYADEGDWSVRKLVNVWDATNTPGDAPPPVGNLDTDPGLEWSSPADPNLELGNAGGASIQLRNSALPNTIGQNWAAATPTPGAANTAVLATNLAPLITEVLHQPAMPSATQQVFVTARIQDELSTGLTATLFYRTWEPNGTAPDAAAFTEVQMLDNGLRGDGAASDGVYGAVIPAQPLNKVVEFYVRAADAGANARTWPAPALDIDGLNPVQNANCLYQVNEEVWTDQRPLYLMVLTGADNASFNAGLGTRQSNVAPNCTVIFRRGNDFDVRYQGSVRVRGNSSRSDTPVNLRMDIPKDNPWNDRTAFTLNYKYSYSQFLATRLMEAAGVPCEKSGVVGARLNGANRILDSNGARSFGFYCDLIPRGGDTVDEWFPDNDDGNAYGKIRAGFGDDRWQVSTLPTIGAAGYPVGGYVNEGFTKQTNGAQNDWTDLHAWMQDMNAGTAADFHTVIADTVDIDEWCRFLAVCTIVNHGETNMSNGDDDDYSVYFGATDRLARLIPHDLDTCFNLRSIGLGDEDAPPSVTIYQCTDPSFIDNASLPQMDKFYRNPVTGRKFKAALRHYLDTLFAKPRFDAMVDQLLDPAWMGTQFNPSGNEIRTQIKTFLDARRTTIETFLPTAFTAATGLTVQNGYPRSTSATDLGGLGGKIDPARTASVTVNGTAVTTNPYGSTGAGDNSWSAGSAVTLKPGINNLVCSAWDEDGALIASQTVSIWYDAPGVNKSGTLAANETWSATAGPYNVTATLTVPEGLTLTIQAGASVFLAPGADLNVAAGGRLLAQGSASAGISFSRQPAAGNWGSVTVTGATAQPTVLSYVTFDGNGDVAFHAQNGANVDLSNLTFKNTAEPYLSLDRSSFIVRNCFFPASTAGFEPVHGSGGIAEGGRGIIRDCRFGKTMGYNDSIDFTGGNRPGPVLHVLNCIFEGSDDDILDLDSTDAWIEGNVFLHAHRNGSPDSASAVSGGTDNADYSQLTVIRNLFYDCDNAVTVKQGNDQPAGNSAALLYNTIVHITKTGGEDTASGVVNFDDDDATGEGKGAYLEGNIIWDVENLTRNYTPALTQVTMGNNLLPAAPPATVTAFNNTVADPRLNLQLITSPGTATAEQVIAALQPMSCSPAIGTGPLGRDKGAGNRQPGIAVETLPASRWPSSFSLAVGPSASFTPTGQSPWVFGYTHYRHRLDSGTQGPETPVATPLALSGLSDGEHTLSVWGRDDGGLWQESPTRITFRVMTGAPTVILSEVLADSATGPDLIELYNWGTVPVVLTGFSLTDDPQVPGKYTITSTAQLHPGEHVVFDAARLGFNLNKGGETVQFHTPGGAVIDAVTFGPQVTGLSLGRFGGAWMLASPSPGVENTAACMTGSGAGLRINEWIGANDFVVSDDFVELYNADANPVSISGWSLTQDYRNEPFMNVFPPLSFIGGKGFLELIADEDTAAGADHLAFRVSRVHDSLALISPEGALADYVAVLPGNRDISQGRTPDGADAVTYYTLPTPGFSNGTNVTGESNLLNNLRITEMRIAPPGSQAEYIELKNIGTAPLTVTGVTFGSGITFSFPALTIAANGYAVITSDLPRFTQQFPGVAATQWGSGRLDNNGESIRLETPQYGLGILDFRYEGDWYPEVQSGAALEIVDPAASRSSWDLRESWQPAAPSPGAASAFGVIAPLDMTINSASPAILNAYVFPGPVAPAGITLAWTKVSGPGNVTFTAPAAKSTDATFSATGTYELRITATGPGGTPVQSDTVVVNVAEPFAAWAARTLAAVPAAQRTETSDPDGDGQVNLVEYALGTSPVAASAGPELVVVDGRMGLRYTVSKMADPALRIVPQVSDALGTWRDGSAYLDETVSSETALLETRVATDLGFIGLELKKFMRLKVVGP